MLVFAVGMETQWGRLKGQVNKVDHPDTPLQKRLHSLLKYISFAGSVVAFLTFCVMMNAWEQPQTKARYVCEKLNTEYIEN